MTTITTSLQLNAGCSSNVMKQENELKSILFVKEEIKKKTFYWQTIWFCIQKFLQNSQGHQCLRAQYQFKNLFLYTNNEQNATEMISITIALKEWRVKHQILWNIAERNYEILNKQRSMFVDWKM